jgi:putative ABC transport system substrate-binding protein
VKKSARGARWGGAGAGFFLFCFGAGAARAASIRVVAVLSKDLPAYHQALEGFRVTFSSLRPGAVVETVTLPENADAARSLMENLSRTPPDLVLAVGGKAARQARNQVSSAPVIFCMAVSNEKGLSYGGVVVDLSLADYLDQIRRAMPGLRRVGFIYTTGNNFSSTGEIKALEEKGVLTPFPADSPSNMNQIMSSFNADCLFLWPDPALFPPNTLSLFLKDALEKRIPVVSVSPSFVKAGATAAFFADFANNGQEAAAMALKVLEGQPLEKIPLHPPTKIKTCFNVSIAQRLDVGITEDALASANEIVH